MNNAERIAKQINQVYYLIYTATILSAIGGYLIAFNQTNSIDPKSPLGITLSSILMIYMLVSIPAALALFHKGTKKWSKIEDEKIKFEKYKKGAYLRLAAVGISLVSSIIVFFILRTESIIYCFAISGIALFFCKPNAGKIASELDLNEE